MDKRAAILRRLRRLLAWGTQMNQFDAKQAAIYRAGKPVTPEPLAAAGYTILYSIFSTDIAARLIYGFIASGKPGEYFIALRGTETAEEWVLNLSAIPVPFPGGGLVAAGFFAIFERLECVAWGGEVVTLREAIATLPVESLLVTGHSLGGAIATLVAADLATVLPWKVKLLTFASPRVGDLFFRNRIDHEVLHDRVANPLDVVTHLPSLPFFHCGDKQEVGVSDVKHTPVKFTPLAQHSLSTYQWLLDPDAYTLPPEFAR